MYAWITAALLSLFGGRGGGEDGGIGWGGVGLLDVVDDDDDVLILRCDTGRRPAHAG